MSAASQLTLSFGTSCSGSWLLLYAVEAAAIMSMMTTHPDKPFAELAETLSGLPLLPRKFFPQSLLPVKEVVASTLAATTAAATVEQVSTAEGRAAAQIMAATAAGDLAEAQAAAAAAPAQLVAAPEGLSKQLEKTLEEIERTAAGVVDQQAPPARKHKHNPKRQSDPDKGLSKRDKELRDRKSYLKNFWYAAGEAAGRCFHSGSSCDVFAAVESSSCCCFGGWQQCAVVSDTTTHCRKVCKSCVVALLWTPPS
jgi:hypothetical protein